MLFGRDTHVAQATLYEWGALVSLARRFGFRVWTLSQNFHCML